jgi:hypothetical protein
MRTAPLETVIPIRAVDHKNTVLGGHSLLYREHNLINN